MSDDDVIRQVVTRLAVKFPDVSENQLHEAAARSLHEFDGARVRDFVPLLAERAAAMTLKSPSVSAQASGGRT